MPSSEQRADTGARGGADPSGGTGRRALPAFSEWLAGRTAIVAAALATVLAVLLLALVWSADRATVLIVLTLGTVVIGQLHSNRQHRFAVRELRRQASATRQLVDREVKARTDAQGHRFDALANQLGRLDKAVTRNENNTKRTVVRETSNAYRELESLANLYAMVGVRGRMPAMRGWAASPDVLLVLVDILRTDRPKLVVECGSGASTLWCALAIRQFGLDARVVSLEHDPEYARRTRELLAAHGVEELAEVRPAPLEAFELDGQTWRWYSRAAWADLDKIGLLFVDGPPADTGPLSRFPALPLLGDKLAGDATVLLDDLIREDEQEVVKRWRDAVPAIAEERLKLEKDASVLRLSAASSGGWTAPAPAR